MNKDAFFKISYGLYLVSSRDGAKFNAHVSNTVFQVSAEPALLAICSNKKNLTTEYMENSGLIGISILEQNINLDFITKFGFKSGRDIDKFAETNFKIGQSGAPIVLDKSVAYLDCEVQSIADVGTHKLFIARVIDAEVILNAPVLTYQYYREIIKGTSPKNAPTFYIPKSEALMMNGQTHMKKWRCELCGYIYDPQVGDPDHGIPAGTDFKDIPNDWHCPICSVDKSSFVPL